MKYSIIAGALSLFVCTNPDSTGLQINNHINHVLPFDAGRVEVKTIRLSTGVELQYAEKGKSDGIPIIFLHGITDSWHSFESVLKELPGNIHAFAITQRGHGDSERPQLGYSPKEFAADVAAFIRQKKLGKVIVAGHSMGGVNTLQFGVDYPELAKGLVIIDSDPEFTDNPGMPEFYQEVISLKGEKIDRKFMDDFQKATLSKAIDSTYYELLVDEGTKTPVRVFQDALTGMMKSDVHKNLHKINVPVLVFWGDKDLFCLRDDQDALIKSVKTSKLKVYESTGHALHWEHPKRFSNDLVEFASELYTSKARK